MKIERLWICMALLGLATTRSAGQQLPVFREPITSRPQRDWLVDDRGFKAEIYQGKDGRDIILDNGLLRRSFRLSPNLACTDYRNLVTGKQLIRSVREEARVNINGKEYNIGGLKGQSEHGYLLPGWLDSLTADPADFAYVSYQIAPIQPRLSSQTPFWKLPSAQASGKRISFLFRSALEGLKGIEVRVNYELYDGMPLLVKSLEISNASGKNMTVNRVVNEVLAMVEEDAAIGPLGSVVRKPTGIYFETDYAFNNAMAYPYSDQTTHWKTDPSYTSQVAYWMNNPCLLEIYPEKVSDLEIAPGETYRSVRTHELLNDGYDRERNGLAIRRMYTKVAPWVLANPISMHLLTENDEQVRAGIDQCAATGYELLIITWYSHLQMEDTSEANYRRWKAIADYAHSKGIKIGCYSLFSSRSISPQDDIIDPATGKVGGALFGKAPCLGSKWGLWYVQAMKDFFQKTGFDSWIQDGPYPGDVCGSTTHPGHRNAQDSQWKQVAIQKELYHWLNARGIYIDSPDWYFLDGSNKIQMGYKEANFRLPRAQQKVLNRQNIYDSMWEKTPSMAWGFVPLTEYEGGGAAATIEPLNEHISDYEQLMVQYYGAGIHAQYRGPRLYDTEATRAMVARVISWYKKYRTILNSDVIHLRRADGRDWDGILHVNPFGTSKERGLAMLYNPLNEAVTRKISLPLYYAGSGTKVRIREREGTSGTYTLDGDKKVEIEITIPAASYTWLVIE